LRPADARQRADLADQALERRGIRGLRLEEQRVAAGHVMALEDVVERRDLAFEIGDAIGMRDQDADERRDVEPEPARVEERTVAEDDAGGFELLDALENGRRREPDRLADAGQRRPAVVLEEAQDLKVCLVQLGRAESHKVGRLVHGTSNRKRWRLSM